MERGRQGKFLDDRGAFSAFGDMVASVRGRRDVVCFHFAPEGGAGDAEGFGGFGLVSVEFFEGGADLLLFHGANGGDVARGIVGEG